MFLQAFLFFNSFSITAVTLVLSLSVLLWHVYLVYLIILRCATLLCLYLILHY